MQICFIEDTHLRGGTQLWVMEATKDFIAKGHEVNIVAPKGSYISETCLEFGATVYTYDWDDIAVNSDKYQSTWTEAFRNSNLAICTVHPPRNGFHCSVFAGKCIKEAELKTILIPKTGSIVPWYEARFYLPEASINHKVICITNYTRKYLIDKYNIPADIITLIYQGTDVDRFSSTPETAAEAKKRYPIPTDAYPVLGSIGSFEDRKGQIIMLQATKKLIDSRRLPNIHTVFVGEGPDEEMLKAVVKVYELEEHVSFFPFTKEPNYIFDSIDILTLSSLYKEGLPNVILEAMSMEIPVVSSRIAGIPEVVIEAETGYMTDIGNIEQLSDAIEKISADKDIIKKMGINARIMIRNKFNRKHQFDAFLNYFDKLKLIKI
ncbi:Glycosyltransferase family 4 protein [Candidatus Magnetomoraceae bacterium gMMP-15]